MTACPELPLSGAMTKRQMGCGLTLSEHVYPSGLRVENHRHDSSYLTFFVAGSHFQRLKGSNEQSQPGTVRFLPGEEPHAEEYREVVPCVHLHIKIDPTELGELEERILSQLRPGRLASPNVTPLFTRIYQEFKNWDDLSPIAIRSLFTELVINEHRSARTQMKNPAWMSRIEDLLRDRFAEHVSLQELSQVSGVHAVQVCRQFRVSHGCTIGEFVRRLRVERASKLLASTQIPLAEIAFMIGCTDQSHFSRMFKLHIGLTPGNHRRLYQSR